MYILNEYLSCNMLYVLCICIYTRFALPYIPDEQTAQYKRRTDRPTARTRGHNSDRSRDRSRDRDRDRDDGTTLSNETLSNEVENEVEVYEASKPEQGELGLPTKLKILLVDDSISILKVSSISVYNMRCLYMVHTWLVYL